MRSLYDKRAMGPGDQIVISICLSFFYIGENDTLKLSFFLTPFRVKERLTEIWDHENELLCLKGVHQQGCDRKYELKGVIDE